MPTLSGCTLVRNAVKLSYPLEASILTYLPVCDEVLLAYDPASEDGTERLFRRETLEGVAVESGGAFLSAELLIKISQRGGRITEEGVPHYPRTAGRASGADPRVVLRAVKDFWWLRLRLWANPASALRRGQPVLADEEGNDT